MKRIDRFAFIFGLMFFLSIYWLPMDPIAWIPTGELILGGGLLSAALWTRRALALKDDS